MSDDDKAPSGLLAAVQELMQASEGDMAAEQLALLPTPGTAAMERDGEDQAGARGPGRPPGSRNKSTSEWARWIRARYRDPREFLAEAYNRPVQQLAAELGCDNLDAFKVQVVCAKELLPYIASKMPTASEGGDKEPVPLAIYVSEQGARLVQQRPGGGVGGIVIEAETIEATDDEITTKSEG